MLSIAFTPMFPWPVLAALAALAALVLCYGLWRRANGLLWRGAALAALFAALANPVLVEEEREPRPDIVVAVVDESLSQEVAGRAGAVRAALWAHGKPAGLYSMFDVLGFSA